jgi:Leucine-rich repeat (LRR) protein
VDSINVDGLHNLEHFKTYMFMRNLPVVDYSPFRNLKKLHSLELLVDYWNPNWFTHLTNLNVLHIHFNKIPSQQINFDSLVNLKYISLINSSDTVISTPKLCLQNLVNFRISGGFLIEDSRIFEGIKNLEVLDLFLVLPCLKLALFKNLNFLKELKVQNNGIKEIDLGMSKESMEESFLPCLETLELANNEIEDLGQLFFSSLKVLKYLNLRNNKIRNLDIDNMRLSSLRKLDLFGNPLDNVELTLARLKDLNIEVGFFEPL